MTRTTAHSVAGSSVMRVLVASMRRSADGAAVITSDAAAVAAAAEPTALARATALHGVNHRVLDWLEAVAPDHPAVGVLAQRNRESASLDMRVRGALRIACATLGDARIPVIAMKGPVLSAMAGGNAIRQYGDLDLLVSPEDIGRAADALADVGAVVMPLEGWRRLLEKRHGQIPIRLPLGVWLDLHWHLSSQRSHRRSFAIDPAVALLSRSERFTLRGDEVSVLDGVDMLLHTAGHAGWSGGDCLGWLVDVDSVVRWASGRPQGLDWDAVVARALQWRVGPLVGDMLARTATVTGCEVPVDVIRRLDSGAVSRLLHTVERMSPLLRESPPPRGLSRIVRFDARATLPASLMSMTSRFATAAVRRVRGVPTDMAEPVFSVPGAGDDEWRDRYLAFAVAEGSPRFSGSLLKR